MSVLSFSTISVAVAQWGGTQAGKLAVTAIWKRLKTPAIIRDINSSLKSDPAIVAAISPPPSLDVARLTEKDVSSILSHLARSDPMTAGVYLYERQLVDLPMKPDRTVESYPMLWNSIGAAILKAATKAVIEDQKLANQFLVSAQQENSQYLPQILIAVEETHGSVKRFESKLDSMAETIDSLALQSRPAGQLDQESAVAETTRFALAKVLGETNKRLSELLGKQAESLWDSIVSDIKHREYDAASKKSRELEALIESNQQLLSTETHGRALLMLAKVELLQIFRTYDDDSNLTRARDLVDQAKKAFGLSPDQENLDRLTSMEARFHAIERDDDAALALLGDSSSPRIVATRLQILIDAGRTSEAVDIIDTLPIHQYWCEEAVLAFANAGKLERALTALDWIDANGETVQKLTGRVALARGAVARLAEQSEAALSVISIGECEFEVAITILKKLSGTIHSIRERGGPESEIESEIVALAYTTSRLIDAEGYREIIALLKSYTPAHVEYAVAMLRGDVDPDNEFPARLRNEHPGWLHAQQLSLLLDVQMGADAIDVMELAGALVPMAKSADAREKLGRMLVQIATTSRVSLHDRAEKQVRLLLGNDHLFVRLIEAHRHLTSDHQAFNKAVAELSGENDTLVRQFEIQVHLNEKHYAEAADLMIKMGRRMSEPDFFLHAALLCMRRKPRRLGVALEALRLAVMLVPRAIQVNLMLADLYYKLQDPEKAAKHYALLYEIEPNEPRYLFNQALCLRQANLPEKALDCLSPILNAPSCNLEAHVIRADIISDMGNPKKAFKELHQVRERFWEDPRYVTAYINTAHAAGEERFAHQGFQKFWSMRCEGVVPKDVIQQKSLEDLIAFSDQAREKRNFLLDQNRFGNLPWLFVEQLMNNVPYWAWRIRTQPMRWFFDDARNRASFSVYSTNSFAGITQMLGKSLLSIKAVKRGTTTVVDQTALMTLDRLGILDEAIQYFSKILLPPSYMIQVLQHRGKLLPHQLSQKEHLERIQSLVVSGRIKAVADPAWPAIVTVAEHGDAEGRTYVLADLFDALHRFGLISDGELANAMRVAHEGRRSPTELKNLQSAHYLQVPLLTMKTIVGQELENQLTESFAGVCLCEGDVGEMQRDLAAFASMEETRNWHRELWDKLRRDNRVDTSTTLISLLRERDETGELRSEPEGEDDAISSSDQHEPDDLTDKNVSLDAALLAIQEDLPLLVDDRVAQNFVLSEVDCRDASFGTDQLILGMRVAGTLNDDRAARAFLKLFEWRYRFIVCPASMLLVVAKTFAPKELLNIARYIHDCMRDPGLFGGMENTTSPSVIAMRFHQKWVQELAVFAVQAWFDDLIDDDRSVALVKIVVTRMLPTIPETMGTMGGRLASFTPIMFFNQVMYNSISFGDREKGNRLLECLASNMGMNEEELSHIVCNVINGNT